MDPMVMLLIVPVCSHLQLGNEINTTAQLVYYSILHSCTDSLHANAALNTLNKCAN